MLGWGPAPVSVAVRRLAANEADHVGVYDHRRHCTVSLGLGGSQSTFVCVLNAAGGYECSRYADGAPPLRNKNATTDKHGVMKLDIPLPGTHPTAPLPWQRYPHVDSFIHPWTRSGKLRRGLTLDQSGGARHYHGTCFRGTEFTHDPAALRCVSDVQFDPCYPRTAGWNRRSAVVACARPGATSFGRFVISRRSPP
jgi:hypothetical protein